MKKGWEVKKLIEIGITQTGTTPKTSNKENYGNFIPFIKPADLDLYGNGEVRYDNEGLSELGLKNGRAIPKDSILMVCIGSIGKVGFIDRDVSCNQQINTLSVKSGLYPKFFYYALRTQYFFQQLVNNSSQLTLPIINKGKWENLEVIFPKSISEQKRIVEILNRAFISIATATENAKKNLQNARELFESYLQSVFANPGKGWEEKTLGQVCSLITDGKHGDCVNKENSGYYFLSAKDVKYNTLNYENARQITKKDFEETHRRTNLKPGNVLVTNSGTIGRMAIAPLNEKTFKTTFQKSVAVIKPISTIMNNLFCCYHLRADLSKLVNVSAGTAQKNLLLGDLRNHRVFIPMLKEQRTIVVKLDELSAETKKLEEIYEKKLADLDELKKSVLQKAFNGELT